MHTLTLVLIILCTVEVHRNAGAKIFSYQNKNSSFENNRVNRTSNCSARTQIPRDSGHVLTIVCYLLFILFVTLPRQIILRPPELLKSFLVFQM